MYVCMWGCLTGTPLSHPGVSWGRWAAKSNPLLQTSAPSCDTHTQLTCLYLIRHACLCICKSLCVCVCYLTGLLLREIRRDSRQLSSCVSLSSVLNSWMYITADLVLSFWLWPCAHAHTHTLIVIPISINKYPYRVNLIAYRLWNKSHIHISMTNDIIRVPYCVYVDRIKRNSDFGNNVQSMCVCVQIGQ